MTKRFLAASFAALVLVAFVPTFVFAQDNAADTAALIDVLQLKPGSYVAEIGAGGGELTVLISKVVGDSGRVYSSDLGADRVKQLRLAAEKSGVTNVQVIEGHETRTNLPDGCCDAVFMRNVYHHFGDPPAMNASILRALKPNGRVAVIDFPPRNHAATAAPGKRGGSNSHGVDAKTVGAELAAAGFRIVTTDERPARWFMVVGAKPAS
jgi:ubiquinone/menaquinone biosynthesis C-methylase UbiE